MRMRTFFPLAAALAFSFGPFGALAEDAPSPPAPDYAVVVSAATYGDPA